MKRYDFTIIGANGIQGRIVTRFLWEEGYSLLLCANGTYGIEKFIQPPRSEFQFVDLRQMDKVRPIFKKHRAPVLVNCAVDDFNLDVTRLALDFGMNYIDLCSEEEMFYKQMELDGEFKAKKIIGITGIGSTPGITNIMLRHVQDRFDTIDTVHLGFAWKSNKPVFVAPFSIDAIAYEFSEPAKVFENGRYVEYQPHQCTLAYNYRSIGRQKTQYTKHIEHHSFYDFLKDKGVKNIVVLSSFPKHSRLTLHNLMSLGLMSKEPITVNGVEIRPLDFTAEVLSRIPVPEGYTEKENLFLKVFGAKNGKSLTVEMDALAGTLAGWESATCNIDTGFPTAILARMIFKGEIAEHGMFSPEFVVPPLPFFKYLGERGIWVYDNGRKINGPPR